MEVASIDIIVVVLLSFVVVIVVVDVGLKSISCDYLHRRYSPSYNKCRLLTSICFHTMVNLGSLLDDL